MRAIHRLRVPLRFPAGVAPGAGKGSADRTVVSRDGRGRFVLRGTALTGALRHAWTRWKGIDDSDPRQPDPAVVERFGAALDRDDAAGTDLDRPSALRVLDVVLDVGDRDVELRAHNGIDRHTGAVRPHGLFGVEALPPGATGTAEIELHADADWSREFLAELAGLLASGLVVGGSGARGIGRVEVTGPGRLRSFDLTERKELGAWLDDSWARRAGGGAVPPFDATDGDPIEPIAPPARTVVAVPLEVPRGQDICIGGGAGIEHQIEPQLVKLADGSERVRLPGSSLRGCLRAWITRLAARDGYAVADAAGRERDDGLGAELGWAFHSDKQREENIDRLARKPGDLGEVVSCPVQRLFGSLYAAGRIHVADAHSADPVTDATVQTRMHVAVDAITGGANDGFLFDHRAVVAGARFELAITIDDASAQEVEWVCRALRALGTGLIRVGSSKSSGRLAIAAPIRASGPHAEAFEALSPQAV